MNAFTTPSELMAAAKRLKIPLKWVGAKDEFEPCTCRCLVSRAGSGTPRPRQGYIINLQSSDDGPGTHWVCVYVAPDIREAAYFDSFGADIPDSVMIKLEGAGIPKRNVSRTKKIIQDVEEGYCGQYCLYFIKKMSCPPRIRTLERRMKDFEMIWYRDAAKNQKMIKDWSKIYL